MAIPVELKNARAALGVATDAQEVMAASTRATRLPARRNQIYNHNDACRA